MTLAQKPRSANTGNHAKFQSFVAAEAGKRVHAKPMYGDGALYVRIIWFQGGRRAFGDVDNIAKPIIDALKGIVFTDDGAVVKCALEKVHTTRDAFELSTAGASEDVVRELTDRLAEEHEHTLYVEVGPIETGPARQIVLGHIDRGGT